jgi:hypothetical protein
MFQNQKLYCNNCGVIYYGFPTDRNFSFCSLECLHLLQEKYTCYVMGKRWEESEFVKKKV